MRKPHGSCVTLHRTCILHSQFWLRFTILLLHGDNSFYVFNSVQKHSSKNMCMDHHLVPLVEQCTVCHLESIALVWWSSVLSVLLFWVLLNKLSIGSLAYCNHLWSSMIKDHSFSRTALSLPTPSQLCTNRSKTINRHNSLLRQQQPLAWHAPLSPS